jgi:flagellar biosynthesis protein FlhG
MANLSAAEQAAVINGFNELEDRYEVLCVDTAAGVSDSVVRVAAAAHHVLVVVCDEPTSLADAYAIIKVLNADQGIDRFQVVTNMSHDGAGSSAYEKLRRVAERFLPVVLYHAGAIPFDARMSTAVRSRKPLVTAFPRSLATLALRRLARRVDALSVPSTPRGNLEFFAERLLTPPQGPRGEIAS